MWLAAHRIELQNATPTVDYILARDSDAITVLRESDRTIERVPAETITADSLCELQDGIAYRSFWDLSDHSQAGHTDRCSAS